jgi:flagellar basal-body rod modification protein FlgD
VPDPLSATGPAGAAQAAQAAIPPTIDPALLQPPEQFGQEMFLQLLVAQLKYQNPMSPMDSSEFMAQTAQFTTVEKLTELTETLTASAHNDRIGTATGLIGRSVTYLGFDGEATATVTGVKLGTGGPALVLSDGQETGLSSVVSVAAAPPAAPSVP